MTPSRSWFWKGMLLALLGCAYYNGLYNANRLATEAERAEREGRRGEARSLWLQAAVKAESVIVRFPGSRHRDDALLMQGRALMETGACGEAVAPLHEAFVTSPDPAVRSQAGLILGRCLLVAERADSAWQILNAVVDRDDGGVASSAYLWRGTASLAMGRFDAALEDFSASTAPTAIFGRVEALLGLRETARAAWTLDSARHAPFDENRWARLLSDLGEQDRIAASDILNRLVREGQGTRGQRARLLILDGERLETRDQALAVERYATATDVGRDSVEGRIASAKRALLRLRVVRDLAGLRFVSSELDLALADGGSVLEFAQPAGAILRHAVAVVDSAEGQDAAMFRLAEVIRDSLHAELLSAWLFVQLSETSPESVFAPKALLATAHLRPGAADSIGAVLVQRYPWSPYTAAARGVAAPGYTALEDSILTLLRSVRVGRDLSEMRLP